MRIFTKILSILFVIVFIFSVSISIILGVSSSNFAKDEAARRKLYYASSYKLSNSKTISISSTAPYSQGEEGQYTKEIISCVVNKENNETTCSMISRLYNEDSSLVRTSYFPGDGYKYTNINGEVNGTKQEYENSNLISYFSSFVLGISMYLPLLAYDNKTINTYSVEYDSNVSFDFNSFSLSKSIDVSYQIGGSTQEISFNFDKNDCVNKVELKNYKSTMTIDYKKANLEFPSFVGYRAA